MDPLIVVGAGISGVQCARELAAAGLPVRVVDRGRRAGGRMSGRRLDDRPVDLGASYFTVSDEGFAAVADGWRDAGLARPWTDTFVALSDEGAETKQGPVRWGAPHGLRATVEALAEGLPVTHDQVVERVAVEDGRLVVDGQPAAGVVLAMPDAQARRVLGAGLDHVAGRLTRESEPALALAAGWQARGWDLDGAFVNDDEVLAWVADDGRRRGDDAPVLVAHSTAHFAARHLEQPEAAGPELVAALRALLDLPEPSWSHVHRWSLAKPTGERDAAYLLEDGGGTDVAGLVGVCGDGWGPQSKVEGAWLSGRELGRALVARLS